MKPVVKTSVILSLTALLIAGCSSTPEPIKHGPYNPADEQRSRSDKTQNELSRETSK